jgi:hypothetical protein
MCENIGYWLFSQELDFTTNLPLYIPISYSIKDGIKKSNGNTPLIFSSDNLKKLIENNYYELATKDSIVIFIGEKIKLPEQDSSGYTHIQKFCLGSMEGNPRKEIFDPESPNFGIEN